MYWLAIWIWRLIDFYILEAKRRLEDGEDPIFREYSDYLTNWNDTLIAMYLLYSTIIAFIGRVYCLTKTV